VYAFISGYGLEGPDADRAAYDVGAFWARSGIAAMLTTPGGDPPFQRGGMGDHTVGVSTAGAVCAALLARDRTGAGQMVTNSLLRQGVYTVGFDLSFAIMAGIQIGIGRRNTMGNPTMNNYTAGDGRKFWVIGQEADRHWPPMCRAVGRSEWLTDDRFATRAGRAMNAAELIGLLDELFATKTFDEWAAAFDTEPEFFWAPINTVDELMADEQFHASGALIDVPDDAGGTVMVASPADFSATPWQARSMAPRLGANTREVLAELGRSSDQIEALLAARRVAEPVLE
jgi:crotonobetainyl-CoA:carnitine CoA-transferase CaiB-like acyl-CoA transferase